MIGRIGRIRLMVVKCFALCLVLLGAVAPLADAAQDSLPGNLDVGVVRSRYLDLEAVARLDHWAQKSHIQRLYTTTLPLLRKSFLVGLGLDFPPIDTSGTPEQVANRILAKASCGPEDLNNRCLDRCREILLAHPQEVNALVSAELRSSGGIDRVDHYLIRKEHYGDLVFLLNGADDAVAWKAARILCAPTIEDPRAISLIVRRFPLLKTDHSSDNGCGLLHLQRGQKADPELVRLLSSPDADLRARATEALCYSGDPALASIGEKLLQDPDPRVRGWAETLVKHVRAH